MRKTKDELEVDGVKEHRGDIAAFFDLDGTLTALPSLERRFFRMLRYRRAIPARNYLLWIREAVRLAPRGLTAILQSNKMYLRGVAVDRTEGDWLKPHPTFFGDGVNRVVWHARQGHAIVLMSGTLEPLGLEAATSLRNELAARETPAQIRVCATRLEGIGGNWTGRVIGEAMFGKAKARAAQRIAAEMKSDLAQSYAYGDSLNDRWLLAAVGRPVAVNPSRKLERIAQKHGWAIMQWSEEKNSTQRTRSTESTRLVNQVARRETRSGSPG